MRNLKIINDSEKLLSFVESRKRLKTNEEEWDEKLLSEWEDELEKKKVAGELQD